LSTAMQAFRSESSMLEASVSFNTLAYYHRVMVVVVVVVVVVEETHDTHVYTHTCIHT
jgi:hypothetical protein